ncbi:MAG: pseudouridine synthase [Candidatus Riflebacteria bacterium]
MTEMVRIQKLLAGWGIASRRAIEEWINAGRIEIDGEKLCSQGFLIDPDNPPVIKIDGKLVKKPADRKSAIYVLHKPANVVSTMSDELGRKSIKDILPPGRRLYPVGRLDMDSTGLLLVTDNGELTNRLLHPSFKVEKEYVVRIEGATLNREEKTRFRQGIELEEGKTAPCTLIQHRDPQLFTVILREGKKRQIKRMFEMLDRKVVQLHRIRFGPIRLGNLKPGQMRQLTAAESDELMKEAGLAAKKTVNSARTPRRRER